MMSEKAPFGQWVRQKRLGRDLTQDILAMRIGCAFETIRKIESGRRRPSRQLATLLLHELGASEDEIPTLIELARAGSDDVDRNIATDGPPPTPRPQPGIDSSLSLPAVRTTFVGREREVESVLRIFMDEGKRLLTLLGPPGIGKTRLALKAAATLSDRFSREVSFVPLSPVTDARLVGQAISHALGVKEVTGQSTFDTLCDQLRQREMLLLLDNFEQVTEAGQLVGDLLTACPLLKVLVTTRIALRVYGEHELRVPALSLPHDDIPQTNLPAIEQYEAVQLFVQRARAVETGFALTEQNASFIVEICRRLDGLPLAIELAAARCRVLTPQAILTRLTSALDLLTAGSKDLPPRQQTLRGAIDWSYDLLNSEERREFSRISVFVGGATLDAAEAVCRLPGEQSDVLELVTSLVEKSMLRVQADEGGEHRFWMLWTIRDYALERLDQSDDAGQVRREHAAYYLRLAEAAEQFLTGPQRDTWLRRLDPEAGNLRAALQWCLESEGGDREMGVRLAGALHWFWYFRGFLSEGRDWLEKALAASSPSQGTAARAKTLNAAGRLALIQDDYATILPRLEEAASIWRETGDRKNLAYALTNLGMATVKRRRERSSGGYNLIEEGVSLFRETGDKWGLAYALDFQADAMFALLGGEGEEVIKSREESLALYRQLGDNWGIASQTSELGFVALRRGDYDKAREILEEAVSMSQQVGDRWYLAHATRSLGDVLWHQGDFARAATLYEESLTLYRQLGDRLGEANALRNLGHLAIDRRDGTEAEQLYLQGLTLVRSLGNFQTASLFLDALAGVHALRDDALRAVRLLGVAAAMREAGRGIVPPPDQRQYSRTVEMLQSKVAIDDFAKAFDEGRTLSIEQALDLINATLPYGSVGTANLATEQNLNPQ